LSLVSVLIRYMPLSVQVKIITDPNNRFDLLLLKIQ
ncbi:MAG: hypothetical protein ACI934_002156, partial [Pseudohongiellaceae bacterium]